MSNDARMTEKGVVCIGGGTGRRVGARRGGRRAEGGPQGPSPEAAEARTREMVHAGMERAADAGE